MNKNLVEMACTANSGRSPMAELIARNYLASAGVSGYEVMSSGTHVDAFRNCTVPQQMQLRCISKALSRGDVYLEDETERAKVAARSQDISMVSDLYAKARGRFLEEEHQYRHEALEYFNILGSLKSRDDQTVARHDRIAVLAMAQSNRDAISGIYQAAGFAPVEYPIIECVGAYATGDSSVVIPDAFGGTKKEYFECIEVIRDLVPKAMEKLLNRT